MALENERCTRAAPAARRVRESRARIVAAATRSAGGSSATSTTALSSGCSGSACTPAAARLDGTTRRRRSSTRPRAKAERRTASFASWLGHPSRGTHRQGLDAAGDAGRAAPPGRDPRVPRPPSSARRDRGYFVVAEALANVVKHARAAQGERSPSRVAVPVVTVEGRGRRRRRSRPLSTAAPDFAASSTGS